MTERQVERYFVDRLKEFGVHGLTVVFDVALVVVWLVGEYLFEHLLVPRLQVDSTIWIWTLWAFRGLFAVSTLVPSGSKSFKHVRVVWSRDRAEEQRVKAEIASAGPEGY